MIRMNIFGAKTTDRPLVNKSSISCHLLLKMRDERLNEQGEVAQGKNLSAREQNAQKHGEADVQDDGDDDGREDQHGDVPLAQQQAVGKQEQQAGEHKTHRLIHQRHDHHQHHAEEKLALDKAADGRKEILEGCLDIFFFIDLEETDDVERQRDEHQHQDSLRPLLGTQLIDGRVGHSGTDIDKAEDAARNQQQIDDQFQSHKINSFALFSKKRGG